MHETVGGSGLALPEHEGFAAARAVVVTPALAGMPATFVVRWLADAGGIENGSYSAVPNEVIAGITASLYVHRHQEHLGVIVCDPPTGGITVTHTVISVTVTCDVRRSDGICGRPEVM